MALNPLDSFNDPIESKMYRLVRSLNTSEPENSALMASVRWNMWFGADYKDGKESKENQRGVFDRVTEAQNINRYVQEFTTSKNKGDTVLGKSIGHTLLEEAISSSNKASTFSDARSSLKSLQGKLWDQVGDKNDEEIVSQTLFTQFYERNLGPGKNNELPVTRRVFSEEKIEAARAKGGKEWMQLVSDWELATRVNADILGVTDTVNRIQIELDALGKASSKNPTGKVGRLLEKMESTDTAVSKQASEEYSKTISSHLNSTLYRKEANYKLGTNSGFLNRPGILPIIEVIESATTDIVIDSFQFQNKSVSDYLFDTISRKVLINPDFNVVIRLAAPRNQDGTKSTELANYQILGPNQIEIQKFAELNERLKEELAEKGIVRSGGANIISFDTQSKRYHNKIYFTDKMAAIGSANITSPFGNSINQAGSNFETLKFVENKINVNNYDRNSYQPLTKDNKRQAQHNKDIRDSLLHKQIHDLLNEREQKNYSYTTNVFAQRKGQIGLSGDIYEHLYTTLDYAYKNIRSGVDSSKYITMGSGVGKKDYARISMFMVLDQAFILQYDKSLYAHEDKGILKGEFGKDDEKTKASLGAFGGPRHKQFREMQRKLFELVAENRAHITIDSKNYRDSVWNPFVEGIMSNEKTRKAWELAGGDIQRLVGYGVSSKVDENAISANIKAKHERLQRLGFEEETQRWQMIAMASGNIRMAAVPRQHVKSYGLVERSITEKTDDKGNKKQKLNVGLLSYYLGSSNLTPGSLGMAGISNEGGSGEAGYMLDLMKTGIAGSQESYMEFLRSQDKILRFQKDIQTSEYSLTQEMMYDEMVAAMEHLSHTWLQLGNSRIEEIGLNNNRVPMNSWERNVSDPGLRNLRTRLEVMRRDLGLEKSQFNIEYKQNATSTKNISLMVSIDIASAAGMGKGYMSPEVGMSKVQFEMTSLGDFIYLVGENKLVSRGTFANNSQGTIGMVFGRELDKKTGLHPRSDLQKEIDLRSGRSVQMSSEDMTLAMLGTLLSEGLQRSLISHPQAEYNRLSLPQREQVLLDYASSLAFGRKNIYQWDSTGRINNNSTSLELLTAMDDDTSTKLLKLASTIRSRYAVNTEVKALRQARLLGGISDREISEGTVRYERRQEAFDDISNALQKMATATNAVDKESIARSALVPALSRLQIIAPEATLDIMSMQQDAYSQNKLKDSLHTVQTSLTEPFLMYHEATNYSAGQAYFRNLLLGVIGEDEETVRQMNLYKQDGEIEQNIINVSKYARMVGAAYSPTTDINTVMYRSVADKSGMSEDKNGQGLKFLKKGQINFGDATDVNLFSSLGVGNVTSKANIQDYINFLRVNNPDLSDIDLQAIEKSMLDELRGEEKVMTFYTGDLKKASQLPQRLKNAMGGKPFHQIKRKAQSIYEGQIVTLKDGTEIKIGAGGGMDSYTRSYLTGGSTISSNEQNRRINIIEALYEREDITKEERDNQIKITNKLRKGNDAYRTTMEKFIDELKAKAATEHQHNIKMGMIDADIIYESKMTIYNNALGDWFTDDYEMGAIFGDKIKKVVSGSQAEHIEKVRYRIMQTFEIRDWWEEAKTKEEKEKQKMVRELLRVTILLDSYNPSSLGSMMGGEDRGALGKGYSIGILQLGGNYSDWFIANADYGTTYFTDDQGNRLGKQTDGIREGLMQFSKKAVKASMVGREDYTELIKVHDMIRQHQESGLFMVHRDGEALTDDAHVVNKGGGISLLGNIVENEMYSAEGKDGSKAELQARAFMRGDDSIDHFLRSELRQGGTFETNQFFQIYKMIKSIKAGGGRRWEGGPSSFLFKGVGVFASTDKQYENNSLNFFEYLAYQHQRAINRNQLQGAFSAYAGDKLDYTTISGLYSQSNLKSYNFTHGSVILRNKEFFKGIFNANNVHPVPGESAKEVMSQKFAGALLMNFGVDFMNQNLPEGLDESELKIYRTEQEEDLKTSLFKIAKEGRLGKHYQIAAALSSALRSEKEAVSSFVKGTSNNLITGILKGFTYEEVKLALEGKDGGKLFDKLENLISLKGNASKLEYLNLDDVHSRQSAVITGALDIYLQMADRVDQTIIPNDLSSQLRAGHNLTIDQVRRIAGFTEEEMSNDKDSVVNLLIGMTQRVSTVMVFMDLASSYSKDPTGANKKGRHEAQHLLKPMLAQAQVFRDGGSVEALTEVVTDFMASIGKNNAYQYYGKPIIDNLGDIRNVLSSEGVNSYFYKRDFLGLYASSVDDEAYQQLVKEYRDITEYRKKKLDKSRSQKSQTAGALLRAMDKFSSTGDRTELDQVQRRLYQIEKQLKTHQARFQMSADKVSGTEYAATVVGEMRHLDFAFFVPKITYEEQAGVVVTKVDNSQGHYSYLPSGSSIETLGAQYGDFVADLVSYTKEILKGFTPGTITNRALEKLRASNKGVVLTQDEAMAIQKWQHGVQNIMPTLVATTAGTTLQTASGGKTPYSGFVSTAVGNWMVPSTGIVLPLSKLNEAGLNPQSYRHNILTAIDQQLTYILDQEESFTLQMIPFKQKVTLAREAHKASGSKKAFYIQDAFEGAEKDHYNTLKQTIKEQKILNKRINTFLTSQQEAVLSEMGPDGTNIIEIGKDNSRKLNAKFKDILALPSNTVEEVQIKIEAIDTFIAAAKNYRKSQESSTLYQAGDKFAILLVSEEYNLWISKAANEKKKDLDDLKLRFPDAELVIDGKRKRIQDVDQINDRNFIRNQQAISRFSRTVVPFEGFLNIGNDLEGDKVSSRLYESGIAQNIITGLIDPKEVRNLKSTSQRSEYINKVLQQTIEEYKDYQRRLQEDGVKRMSSSAQGSNRDYEILYKASNERLEVLILELSNIQSDFLARTNTIRKAEGRSVEGRIDGRFIEEVITKINSAVGLYDRTSLNSSESFRSPPFGQTEPHFALYRIIEGVSALNEYAGVTGDQSTSRVGQMNAVFSLMLDDARNKTATFLNPLGMHTFNLGDFDGDPYTTIFNFMAGQEKVARDRQRDITWREMDIKDKESQIESYKRRYENLEVIPEQIQKRIEKLTEEIAKHKKAIANAEQDIIDTKTRVNDMRNETVKRIGVGVRQEFSRLEGIDERHFIGRNELDSQGRAGWANSTVSIDVLPTYINQGMELYGGIQGKGKEGGVLLNSFNELFIKDFDNDVESTIKSLENATEDFVSLRASGALSRLTKIDSLSEDVLGREFLQKLTTDKDIQKVVAQELKQLGGYLQQQRSQNSHLSATDFKDYIQRDWLGGHLFNRLTANEEIAGILSKGSHAMNMDDSTFEMLLGSLGAAGGQILGKTYNSLVGTLYADAPILAIGHALTKNSAIEESTISHIDDLVKFAAQQGQDLTYEGKIITGEDFIKSVKTSMDYSAGIQGFLKNVQQLLRDSIKFKSDSGQELSNTLKVMSENYNKATDPKDKENILRAMASSIGPGPGLLALMRLDNLVSSSDMYSTGVTKKNLLEVHGILASPEEEKFQRIVARLNAAKVNGRNIIQDSELTEIYTEDSEEGKAGTSVYTKVANYSTSRDLIAMVAAYRWEKLETKGRSFFEHIKTSSPHKYGMNSFEEVQSLLTQKYLGEGEEDNRISRFATHRETLASILKIENKMYDQKGQLTDTYREAVRNIIMEQERQNGVWVNKKKSIFYGTGLMMVDESITMSEESVRPWLGEYGELMNKLSSEESQRKRIAIELAKNKTDINAASPEFNKEVDKIMYALKDSPIRMIQTVQQLASQGKIGEEGAKMYAQVVSGMLIKAGINPTSNKSALEKSVLDFLLDPDKQSTHSEQRKTLGILQQLRSVSADIEEQSTKIQDEEIEVWDEEGNRTKTRKTYSSITNVLSSSTKETLFGSNSRLIQQWSKSLHKEHGWAIGSSFAEIARNTYMQEHGLKDLTEQHLAAIKERESVLRLMFEESSLPQKQQADQLRRMSMFMIDQNPLVAKGSIGGRMSREQINTFKSISRVNTLEFIVPLSLTAIGAALGVGDADPQATQMMIGSMFSALSYVRPSFTSQGGTNMAFNTRAGHVLGSAFAGVQKFRTSLRDNQGDYALALRDTAIRELVMGGTQTALTPIFSEFITKQMMGINKLTIDTDRYLATKTLAGSASGAVLGALTGLFMSNMIVNSINAGGIQIPGSNIVDAALSNASSRIAQLNQQKVRASEALEDLTAYDEDTGTDVPLDIEFEIAGYNDYSSKLDSQLQTSVDMPPDINGNYISGTVDLRT